MLGCSNRAGYNNLSVGCAAMVEGSYSIFSGSARGPAAKKSAGAAAATITVIVGAPA